MGLEASQEQLSLKDLEHHKGEETGSECTVVLIYMLMNCEHLPMNQTLIDNTNTCGQKILLMFSQLVHH